MDLDWHLRGSSSKPESYAWERDPPIARDNKGALQVRLMLDGHDHFINRIGRSDDPVAQARGQAICAEIWRDAQEGGLGLPLNRYFLLVEGQDRICSIPSPICRGEKAIKA